MDSFKQEFRLLKKRENMRERVINKGFALRASALHSLIDPLGVILVATT